MDKYQQHELLGQGNNSVYRATRLSDGVDVALKRVKGWAALEAADQEVALREVAMLRTLDHPHTITLLDSFSDGGDLCLVLPLVHPGTRVFEGSAQPLSPPAVERVGFQLASALAYLHGQQPQLLHRDIKPANLLLAAAPGSALPPPGPLSPAQASALVEAGSVLLSDFGSALAMRRTLATGTTSGTPAYKASEILSEDEYAAPADVWSYGVTLLQLATGHIVGGTTAARRALMGKSGTPWTLQQALEGVYHDKFVMAGEEEAWSAACAAQHKAWERLEAPLQQLIESCLVVEADSRATAAALLQHVAFEKERRAECLAAAVAKLEALVAAAGSKAGSSAAASTQLGGGNCGAGAYTASSVVTLDELLAVLEAGAGDGVTLPVLQCACEQAVRTAEEAGEVWVKRIRAALLDVSSGADLDKVMAAIKALHGLQGVGGASGALEGGTSVVMSAAARLVGVIGHLCGNNESLAGFMANTVEDKVRQAEERTRKEAEIARLTEEVAQMRASRRAAPAAAAAPKSSASGLQHLALALISIGEALTEKMEAVKVAVQEKDFARAGTIQHDIDALLEGGKGQCAYLQRLSGCGSLTETELRHLAAGGVSSINSSVPSYSPPSYRPQQEQQHQPFFFAAAATPTYQAPQCHAMPGQPQLASSTQTQAVHGPNGSSHKVQVGSAPLFAGASPAPQQQYGGGGGAWQPKQKQPPQQLQPPPAAYQQQPRSAPSAFAPPQPLRPQPLMPPQPSQQQFQPIAFPTAAAQRPAAPPQPLTPQQAAIVSACYELHSILQPYLTEREQKEASAIPGAIEVLSSKFSAALVLPAVEAKLVALTECFQAHDYRSAEKAAASLVSSDWHATKEFIRPLKLLSTLGLSKSSGQ